MMKISRPTSEYIEYIKERRLAFIFMVIGGIFSGPPLGLPGLVFGYATGLMLDYGAQWNKKTKSTTNEQKQEPYLSDLCDVPPWKILLIWLIDLIIAYILFINIITPFGVYFQMKYSYEFGDETLNYIANYTTYARAVVASIFALILASKWQTSFGGKILRVVIKRKNGQKIGLFTAFVRMFVLWGTIEVLLNYSFLINNYYNITIISTIFLVLVTLFTKGTITFSGTVTNTYMATKEEAK